MLRSDRLPMVIEELEIAGGNIGRPEAQSHDAAIYQREIRKPPQCKQHRRGVVEAHLLRRRLRHQKRVHRPWGKEMRLTEQ